MARFSVLQFFSFTCFALYLIIFSLPAFANKSYTYDDLGRLSTAEYANGVKVRYTYDANGNRVAKVADGAGYTGTLPTIGSLAITGSNNNTSAIDPASDVLLVWDGNDSNDHIYYDVYLAEANRPFELVAGGLTTESYWIDDALIEELKSYRWKVVVKDARGNRVHSVEREFSTRSTPQFAVSLDAPAPNAPRNSAYVNFAWSMTFFEGDQSQIIEYRIYTGSTPVNVNTLRAVTQSTSLPVPVIDTVSTTYWRVEAAGQNWSAFSNVVGVLKVSQAIVNASTDSDQDSMSDAWELVHSFNPNFDDSQEDPDGDGISNRNEYFTGTDPHNPSDHIPIIDFENNTFDGVVWLHDLSAPWTIDSSRSNSGTYSARSAVIGNSSVTQLETVVTTTRGDVTFYVSVDAHISDYMDFLVDGQVKASWNGNNPFFIVGVPIEEGHHRLTWRYRKNGSLVEGADAVWIDDIVIPLAAEDSDGDGVLDAWERYYFGVLDRDLSQDYDGDQLSDFEEYQLNTNPTRMDSDGDQLPDKWEIDNGLNPLQAADALLDNDGDGVNNRNEFYFNSDPNNPLDRPLPIDFENGLGESVYWINRYGHAWRIISGNANTGSHALGVPVNGAAGTYRVETAVKTRRGDLEFHYKVDSDVASEKLRLYIDNVLVFESGTSPYQKYSRSISPGVHTFVWEFYRASGESPSFAAIDTITIPVDTLDEDADGIVDGYEHIFFQTLDHDMSLDSDADGLNDFQEYLYRTHPKTQDMDNDGYSDLYEIVSGSDPNDGISVAQDFRAYQLTRNTNAANIDVVSYFSNNSVTLNSQTLNLQNGDSASLPLTAVNNGRSIEGNKPFAATTELHGVDILSLKELGLYFAVPLFRENHALDFFSPDRVASVILTDGLIEQTIALSANQLTRQSLNAFANGLVVYVTSDVPILAIHVNPVNEQDKFVLPRMDRLIHGLHYGTTVIMSLQDGTSIGIEPAELGLTSITLNRGEIYQITSALNHLAIRMNASAPISAVSFFSRDGKSVATPYLGNSNHGQLAFLSQATKKIQVFCENQYTHVKVIENQKIVGEGYCGGYATVPSLTFAKPSGDSFSRGTMVAASRDVSVALQDNSDLYSQVPTVDHDFYGAAPTVTIAQPSSGDRYLLSDTISLSATAMDTQDGDMSAGIYWYSDLEGFLGAGSNLDVNLSVPGGHRLFATVMDSDSNHKEESVFVSVSSNIVDFSICKVDYVPDIEWPQGYTVQLRLTNNSDNAFNGFALSWLLGPGEVQTGVTWEADFDFVNTAEGVRVTASTDQVIAVGSFKNFGLVVERPVGQGTYLPGEFLLNGSTRCPTDADLPGNRPDLTIQTLVPKEQISVNQLINLTASAVDVEDGDLSMSVQWESSRDGPLGTGNLNNIQLSAGVHHITAKVLDSDLLESTALLLVAVTGPNPSTIFCRVDYSARDPWDTGFVADIAVNLYQGPSDYVLNWQTAANETVENHWNGVLAIQGRQWTFDPSFADFGLSIGNDGSPSNTPTVFYLNGQQCTAKTPTDRDGDGLPDAHELIIGTDPDFAEPTAHLIDTDGDGVVDILEIRSGTDPLVDDGQTPLESRDEDIPFLPLPFLAALMAAMIIIRQGFVRAQKSQ